MLAKIDQAILDFWFTSPNERAWVYSMTTIPVLTVIATIINYLQEGRSTMTDTEQQLQEEISKYEGKIIQAGKYISAVAEGIPGEGIVKYSDGLVIDDPIAKADEIIKTAHEIKKMSTQYQALITLDDKIYTAKEKAINSDESLAAKSL